jgi:Fe-S-cluster containining protein
MDSIPCEQCGSKCCKSVTWPIGTPNTSVEFDHIRWCLLHEDVRVFIDHDDGWHIEFLTPCAWLGDDGLCRNYSQRPEICRIYGTEQDIGVCEYVKNPYKERFKRVEEFDRWYARWLRSNQCRS